VPDIDDLTIPDSAAALEEMLSDPKSMKAVFGSGNPGKAQEFLSNYARTVLAKDQEIASQVREETRRVVRDWLKENGEPQRPDIRPDISPGAAQDRSSLSKIHNSRAMGAAIDKEIKSSGDYFRLIWHNSQRDASDQARISRIRNAFSTTVPSEGGFLLPETLRSEMLRVSLETAIVRPRARVIPMETLRVPFPAIDSTSNASSVYGGIVGYWTEEGATLTASSAAFSRITLDAKKLTAYTEVPNELIADSIGSFEAFINEIFPEALGFYEDAAFLTGSGVGEPLGMLNGTGLVAVTKETNQVADTIVWENVVKMYSRMLPSSLNRAVWIASPDTLPQLMTMAQVVGTGGVPVFLPASGAAGQPYSTLMGRPLIFSEKVPTLGDAKDLCFVDPGFYLIGDRQVMSALSSPHFKFSSDQTAFRIISRVDGQPWLQSAITPKNSGSTLSPYVTLGERA
jgi:HK97 family phage major capsid protein